MLLDNDSFLVSLTKMFGESKTGKSLFITMKRYNGQTKPTPRKSKAHEPHALGENSCLMRVTTGNKKISTVVFQKDLNRFNQAYADVIKGNIVGLKKRDKRSTVPAVTKQSKAPVAANNAVPKSPKS